ncbi:hypothetical protein OQA88_13196 [Cercophora sp. LCS_1]
MAATAATIIGVNAFTQPCHYPYDQCGWVLAGRDYGYSFDELQAAANSDDGSYIYDALYSCDSETGELKYITWCGIAACGTGTVPNDNCVDLNDLEDPEGLEV